MPERHIFHGTALLITLLSAVFYFNTTRVVFADTPREMFAVQERKYTLRHEFNLSGGILPLDAFAKGLSIGASYTYHFTNFTALELINAHLVTNFNTDLRSDLENNFGVTTTAFDLIQYYATVNYLIKPIYRKMVLFNRHVLHGETSLLAGGGAARYDSGLQPMGGAGVIFRAWLSKMWSLRLDMRDYVVLKGGDIDNVLLINFSVSLNYPWK